MINLISELGNGKCRTMHFEAVDKTEYSLNVFIVMSLLFKTTKTNKTVLFKS